MDGYTLYISRCSGGDGVEESFKAKIKRREDALDAFAIAEAYCKEIGMVSRCEQEGFDGFIIDLCSDAEDETIRLVRLVADSEEASWMMYSVWNTAVASIRFRYAIGKFIHAFIYRIYGVYRSPACWYASLLYL